MRLYLSYQYLRLADVPQPACLYLAPPMALKLRFLAEERPGQCRTVTINSKRTGRKIYCDTLNARGRTHMISRVPAAFLLFFFGFVSPGAGLVSAAAASDFFFAGGFAGIFESGLADADSVGASTTRVSPSTPFSSTSVSSQNSSVAAT
jgi:hypothetical protein